MESSTLAKPGTKKWGAPRRQEVDLSAGLVKVGRLAPGSPLPVLVEPEVAGVDLITWAAQNRALLDRWLHAEGGVLFRGFQLDAIADFERLIAAVSGELLRYSYRSTPRSEVEGRIYTSTEYPPHQSIPLHNEMSYSRAWPMKIWFYCQTAAPAGGETPIADSRRVWAALPVDLRRRFVARGVMYVRNYGRGLDLAWQEVFNTTDRGEVAAFCRAAGIDFTWQGEDGLSTRQVCQAAARHPATGELVWFNQAHLFHVSGLDAAVRRSLVEDFTEAGLPRNACFGDGAPIPDSDLDAIRAVLDAATVVFPWRPGDLLLLDNMLTAHARRPFSGPRKILVGMAEEGSGYGIGAGDLA